MHLHWLECLVICALFNVAVNKEKYVGSIGDVIVNNGLETIWHGTVAVQLSVQSLEIPR
jgi:hypothetical protein